MGRAYEMLCDPCDRYVLWDLVDDVPVLPADRDLLPQSSISMLNHARGPSGTHAGNAVCAAQAGAVIIPFPSQR